jgi:DNA polymerase
VAADIMTESMFRVEAKGYPVVLTVHDEVIAETKKNHGSIEEYLALLSEVPEWAKGLPIKVEGWENERYARP